MRPDNSSATERKRIIASGRWACDQCIKERQCHSGVTKEEARAMAAHYAVLVYCARREVIP
jgi:hypothetical protein